MKKLLAIIVLTVLGLSLGITFSRGEDIPDYWYLQTTTLSKAVTALEKETNALALLMSVESLQRIEKCHKAELIQLRQSEPQLFTAVVAAREFKLADAKSGWFTWGYNSQLRAQKMRWATADSTKAAQEAIRGTVNATEGKQAEAVVNSQGSWFTRSYDWWYRTAAEKDEVRLSALESKALADRRLASNLKK